MSLFGVASKNNCYNELFFGTDYQTHRGPKFGGLAFLSNNGNTIDKVIKDIKETQFKGKFSELNRGVSSQYGIGVISALEEQPITLDGKVGNFAVCMDGNIENAEELSSKLKQSGVSFKEKRVDGHNNSTEIVANLINQGKNIVDGIQNMYKRIDGSVSLLLLTKQGIYASSDRFPLFIGKKENAWAVASENSAFHNLGFEIFKNMQPREIVKIDKNGPLQKFKGDSLKQICAFLWIYTGFPSSTYEGVSAEEARYRCGAALARRDNVNAKYVGGIPDSGVAHGIGYSEETIRIAREKTAGILKEFENNNITFAELKKEIEKAQKNITTFARPIVKYTPSYGRSYTPTDQATRDLVAGLKLIPNLFRLNKKNVSDLLITEDSIVRGTQLREYLTKMQSIALKEGIELPNIHIRVACPPLMWPCKYNISTRTKEELAARRAIKTIEEKNIRNIRPYLNPDSEEYNRMVEVIRKDLKVVNTLQYQRIEDMVDAIGLPKEKLCLYCWNGQETPSAKR